MVVMSSDLMNNILERVFSFSFPNFRFLLESMNLLMPIFTSICVQNKGYGLSYFLYSCENQRI